LGGVHPGPGKNSFSVAVVVANTGRVAGDEVVMVFHSAGRDVRARIGDSHPVPAKALVGFERVRLEAGEQTTLRFDLQRGALELVNASGLRHLYPGSHTLLFSRGHGADVAINVTAVGRDLVTL
jgi:hypothetical protein